jgi:hypothetical protein
MTLTTRILKLERALLPPAEMVEVIGTDRDGNSLWRGRWPVGNNIPSHFTLRFDRATDPGDSAD